MLSDISCDRDLVCLKSGYLIFGRTKKFSFHSPGANTHPISSKFGLIAFKYCLLCLILLIGFINQWFFSLLESTKSNQIVSTVEAMFVGFVMAVLLILQHSLHAC